MSTSSFLFFFALETLGVQFIEAEKVNRNILLKGKANSKRAVLFKFTGNSVERAVSIRNLVIFCLRVQHELHNNPDGLIDSYPATGKSDSKCKQFAEDLKKHFSLKTLGKIDKYLGVQIIKTKKGFGLSQREKILELVEKCSMEKSKPVGTPMQTDFLRNMYCETLLATAVALAASAVENSGFAFCICASSSCCDSQTLGLAGAFRHE
ncbi:hypothetical protein L345_04020, partial [Ophiophagus hannah]